VRREIDRLMVARLTMDAIDDSPVIDAEVRTWLERPLGALNIS